jgi:hypothetical protein
MLDLHWSNLVRVSKEKYFLYFSPIQLIPKKLNIFILFAANSNNFVDL